MSVPSASGPGCPRRTTSSPRRRRSWPAILRPSWRMSSSVTARSTAHWRRGSGTWPTPTTSAKLHAIWQGESRKPITARYERELREQLPDYLKDAKLTGTSTWLYRGLRDAEAAGLIAGTCWPGPSMRARWPTYATSAPSLTPVCASRRQGLVPQLPKPWAERVPEDEHITERHELPDGGRPGDG